MYPTNNFDYNQFDDNGYESVVPEDDAVESRGKLINQQYVADLLINAEVLLPKG